MAWRRPPSRLARASTANSVPPFPPFLTPFSARSALSHLLPAPAPPSLPARSDLSHFPLFPPVPPFPPFPTPPPPPPPFLSQDEIKAKAGAAHDHTNATKATLVAKVQAVKDRLEDALEAATARPRKEYHVAFSGSGSLAVFQLGVSAALEEYRVYTEV